MLWDPVQVTIPDTKEGLKEYLDKVKAENRAKRAEAKARSADAPAPTGGQIAAANDVTY